MSHYITALKLGATLIDGIQDSDIDPGIEHSLHKSDGMAWNTMVVLDASDPKISFASKKIDALLSVFGLDGYKISATPLDAYTIGADLGGSLLTTGEKISMTSGVVVPMRLSASQKPGATLQYQAFGAKSDGAAPWTVTSAQTAPTGMLLDELFRSGDVTIGGASIGPVAGFDIAWTNVVPQDRGDGMFPMMVNVETLQPVITVRSRKVTAAAQVTLAGSASVMVLNLLECTAGTGLSAAGPVLTTHLNAVFVSKLSGSQTDKAVTEITCVPVYDGTNSPITIS